MDRIIKQRVVAYDANDDPVELTPYVEGWRINNGGIHQGASGIDGVVVTADIVIKNDLEANFNPEAEYGVWVYDTLTIAGADTNTYSGAPDFPMGVGVLNVTPETESLYGLVRIEDNNFIFGNTIPTGTSVKVGFSYMDYTQRNPINTVDGAWSPLLDENTRVEIYAQEQETQWMRYRWKADGTNTIPNPTPGTPLAKGVGVVAFDIYSEFNEWDDFNVWYTFDPWSDKTNKEEYYTYTAEYDSNTDNIILGFTPPAGSVIDLSISYFIEDFAMIFKGYMGDSILVSPKDQTISLSCRDKGKILQDRLIDGLQTKIDPSTWTNYETEYFCRAYQDPADPLKLKLVVSDSAVIAVGSAIKFKGGYNDYPEYSYEDGVGIRDKKFDGIAIISEIVDNGTVKFLTLTYQEYENKLNKEGWATDTIDKFYYLINSSAPSTVIFQNILDQAFEGETIPTLYSEVSAEFIDTLEVTNDLWDKKSVWDTLQDIASLKQLYLQHLWNEGTGDFELTLRELDLEDTTIDYAITTDRLYDQDQELTGSEIRNHITVYYEDVQINSNAYVTRKDDTSIARYGTRNMIITEAKTAGINTALLATDFAERVLANLKDKVIDSNIEIPFRYSITSKRLEVTDILSVNYKYLDTTNSFTPFYFIESIEHTYNASADNSRDKFRTVLRGNKQKVSTGRYRDLKKDARPGTYKQFIGRDLSELYQIPAPDGLEVLESGLESVALTPQAYAVLQWRSPMEYLPSHFILEVAKATDEYTQGEQYTVTADSSSVYSQRVKLDTLTEYKWRVVAWSKTNVKGVVTDDQSITGIGDDTIPDDVTGLSVVGLDEGVQVSFNPNTEADLLGYNIYVRKGADPTTSTYDELKVTNSNITVIGGLDPGTYHIGVTAFDTSGNESDITPIQTAEISPIFYIRTQSDLDRWASTLVSNIFTGSDLIYKKVKIYKKSTAYTINFTNKGILSDDFEIEGIGVPLIECDTYFDTKVDNLTIKGCSFYFRNDSALTQFIKYYQYSTADSSINILNNIFETADNTKQMSALDVLDNLDNVKINIKENIFINQGDNGGSLQIGLDSSDTNTSIDISKNKFKSPVEFDAIQFYGKIQNLNITENYFENGHIYNFISGGATDGSISGNTFVNDINFASKYYISGNPPIETSFTGNTIKNTYSGATGYYMIQGSSTYSTITGNIANGTTAGFLTGWIQTVGTGTILSNNTKN